MLVFLFLGLIVAVAPGLLVGYVFVAVSGKLPLTVRVLLLVVLAMGAAALWLGLGEPANVLLPLAMLVSFLATLASGAAFLGLEARKRRAPRYPAPTWQSW
ncbi:hypothetical protein OG444_39700 [Streptomyces sp. NBC_01232]|uniref:hypothetical protein n=1 Tax=Streptomyces sp. NBC_01232 TaxID=2903786 RepID=UPI002E1622B5|nr:hypothetical protein OG444_00130 [Streptomyces sp. NBC_01232]WSQ03254.1 hypothetical protein OG444_39700 [Streptomyces sp. NBC_01232]